MSSLKFHVHNSCLANNNYRNNLVEFQFEFPPYVMSQCWIFLCKIFWCTISVWHPPAFILTTMWITIEPNQCGINSNPLSKPWLRIAPISIKPLLLPPLPNMHEQRAHPQNLPLARSNCMFILHLSRSWQQKLPCYSLRYGSVWSNPEFLYVVWTAWTYPCTVWESATPAVIHCSVRPKGWENTTSKVVME